MSYHDFIQRKSQLDAGSGFDPIVMPGFLFDFQASLVDWACRMGRAAIFADCVAAETLISTEEGVQRIAELAASRHPLKVWCRDQNGALWLASATKPWVNGFGSLYRLRLSSGRELVCSKNHRVMVGGQWLRVSQLRLGARLLVSGVFRPRSTEVSVQSIPRVNDPRLIRTVQDLTGRYFACLYPDGERLRQESGSDQFGFPSQADVPGHTHVPSHMDDLESISEHSRHYRFDDHLATLDCDLLDETMVATGECRTPSSGHTWLGESSQILSPDRADTIPSLPILGFGPLAGREFSDVQCGPCGFSFDTLVSIQYIRDDVFYDIEVPGFANYFANGILSHNCGMGKTVQQLVWSDNIVRKTGKPVLIMAPLSVSQQTVEEAQKFDIDAVRCMTGTVGETRIYVTNYERLHHFKPDDFGGVVCDESSIIKNFDGARKGEITEFMKKIRYRLLCTATAAPNDYIELGTSSEALGYLGFMDMLGTFFKNDEDSLHPAFIGSKWRFKRHAEQRFWRWMASWARACRKPSDLGFDDRNFVLPKLIENEHVVRSAPLDGFLFDLPAITLAEQQAETRETIKPRCEKAAELLSPSRCGIAWAHLNAEADLLEKLIPGAVQVKGGDADDRKEEVFLAFRRGQIRKLVTKPKIASLGMNWQHCAHMTWFINHSYEQHYQAIRRLWRYGQTEQVTVDNIGTTSQAGVSMNLRNKAHAAEQMFIEMVRHMGDAAGISRMTNFGEKVEVAPWL